MEAVKSINVIKLVRINMVEQLQKLLMAKFKVKRHSIPNLVMVKEDERLRYMVRAINKPNIRWTVNFVFGVAPMYVQ